MATLVPPPQPVPGSRESDAVNAITTWMNWVEQTLQTLEDERDSLATRLAAAEAGLDNLDTAITGDGSVTEVISITQAEYNSRVAAGTINTTTQYVVVG